MGYALPAAIGAKLTAPGRQVVCMTGDGGFQVNLQELQTAVHYGIDMTIAVMNNDGYGIIKQFQDAYLAGRHHATATGYSQPDFGRIAAAYCIDYHRIERPNDIRPEMLATKGLRLLDIILDPHTPIEPKFWPHHTDFFMANDLRANPVVALKYLHGPRPIGTYLYALIGNAPPKPRPGDGVAPSLAPR